LVNGISEGGVVVRSQAAIFGKLVKDYMTLDPLAVSAATPCGQVVARMVAQSASGATIIDHDGRPLGIVTEHDIVHRVVFQQSPDTAIDAVMTTPVATVEADDYLYRAIARMRRADLRHMPAVDDDGRLVGMLDLHDAIADGAGPMMDQIDRLTHEGTLDGLARVKDAQIELAGDMIADNMPAPDIQALLTHINNDIYRRVVEASLQAMADDGLGQPPVRFCIIVMGSGGRGENYLFPDQDNGFILDDYADGDHDRIDGFFIELAERMTRDLDHIGFPLCKGYVMATNPLWRKTLSQWIAQIRLWSRKRSVTAIRLADIFFDFQPVCGDRDLATALRDAVTEITRGNHPFLQQMFHEEADHGVALGFFGGFKTMEDEASGRQVINLKHAGLLPLVETVRLLALRDGVKKTSTMARIEALHASGAITSDDREFLLGGQRILTDVLLAAQIRAFKKGQPVGYLIDPESLSKRRREQLIRALESIRRLRGQVRGEFTGAVF
jgi:signal-transduction protein with cAMP-binding, CBS, and nucleotidyltransferase domain